jgi:hypothetical protein
MALSHRLGLAALILAVCPWATSQAGVYVGLGFGGPCYRPYYRPYYGYGYYRPFVYVAPPPVVVGGPPVIVAQPAVIQQPIVTQPAYPPPAQPPAPLPPPTPAASSTPDVMPTVSSSRPGEMDAYLEQLRSGDEATRADALVRLGRLRAENAIGPMVKALNSDPSPKVREAAARGLGLIGSATALSALQYAAQADDDREVRHSASFAAEVIRGHMRR